MDRLVELPLHAVERSQIDQGANVLRSSVVEFLQDLGRLLVSLILRKQEGARADGEREVGLELQRLIDVGQGLVFFALLLKQARPQQEQHNVLGFDLQRLVEILHGGLRLLLLRMHVGLFHQQRNRIGFELLGFVERGERLVEPLQTRQHDRLFFVEARVVRLQRKDPIQIGQRRVELAQIGQQQSAGVQGRGIARRQTHRLVEIRQPFLRLFGKTGAEGSAA